MPAARFEVRTLSNGEQRIYVKHTTYQHWPICQQFTDAHWDTISGAYVLPAKSSCAAALLRAYDGLEVEYYAAFTSLCPTSTT